MLDDYLEEQAVKRERLIRAGRLSASLTLDIPQNAVFGWKRFGSLSRGDDGVSIGDWFGAGLDVRYCAGHPMVAACLKRWTRHDAPGEHCKCGIWTFERFEGVVNFWRCGYVRLVVGRVAQWGRVYQERSARRSEFAYPVALYTDYRQEAELCRAFCDDVRPLTPLLNEYGRGWCYDCARVKRLERLRPNPDGSKDDFVGEPLICETCVRTWRVAL